MIRALGGLLLVILTSFESRAEDILIENRSPQPFVHQFQRSNDGAWDEPRTIPSGAIQKYSTPVPLVIGFREAGDWIVYQLTPGETFRYQPEAHGCNQFLKVSAVPEDEDAAHLTSLLRHRCLVARREVEAVEASYNTGVIGLDQLLWAQSRWLDAEWDLCETPAQRVAICQQRVSLARNTHARIYALCRLGVRGGECDREAQARQNLLIAEIQLLRERIKAKSAGSVPSVLVPNCDPAELPAIAAVEALGGRVELDSDQVGAHAIRLSFPYADAAVFDLLVEPCPQLLPWERPPTAAKVDASVRPGLLQPSIVPVPPLPPPSKSEASVTPPPGFKPAKPAPPERVRTLEEELAAVSQERIPRSPGILTDVSPRVPEATLQRLGQLRKLQSVDFSRVMIADADLNRLNGLHELRELIVAGELTDVGLEYLSGFTKIERLVVGGSFTDAGLDHLGGLTTLRSLEIRSPHVTAAGLARLRKALPQAKLHESRRADSQAGEIPETPPPSLPVPNLPVIPPTLPPNSK